MFLWTLITHLGKMEINALPTYILDYSLNMTSGTYSHVTDDDAQKCGQFGLWVGGWLTINPADQFFQSFHFPLDTRLSKCIVVLKGKKSDKSVWPKSPLLFKELFCLIF